MLKSVSNANNVKIAGLGGRNNAMGAGRDGEKMLNVKSGKGRLESIGLRQADV